MSDKDIFKDIFSSKLENYEPSVNPKVWSAISSKIGTAATAGSVVGISFLSKLIIGLSISAVAAGGVVLVYTNTKQKTARKDTEKTIVHNPLVVKEDIKNSEKKALLIDNPKNTTLKTEDKIEFNSNTDVPVTGIENSEEKEVAILTNTNKEDKVTTPQRDVYKSPSQDAIEKVVPTISVTPEELQIEDNEVFEKIKLPNTFTPNMDGVNDEFKILLVDLTAFSIVILDAKNKIVYKSEDPEFKWNGVGLNGEMVDSGNYIYYITAKNSKGKDVLEYSTLTIIR